MRCKKHFKKQHEDQFMDRLNRQYSDFSEVVNPETLSILEEKEPELAATIADLKDPYKIGVQSYKYIKAMGLSKTATEEQKREGNRQSYRKVREGGNVSYGLR